MNRQRRPCPRFLCPIRTAVVALVVLVVAAMCGAAPASAGTGYVPVTANLAIDGVEYQTALWITNLGTTTGAFSTRFIPTGADGTADPDVPGETRFLSPGGTYYLRPLAPAGSFGILEVTADAGMVAEARLIATPAGGDESLGAAMPIVTSENVVAAGGRLVLQGLERDGAGKISNLGLLNTGEAVAQCSLSLFLANNAQIGQTALAVVPPFGHREFGDVLGLVGQAAAAHVRAEVSCDQPFFGYYTLYDVAGGKVVFSAPSGEADLGEPPSAGCPPTAVCYDAAGLVHRPTPANPVGRVTFDTPAGTYRRIRLQMDVKVGAWYPQDPDGKHLVYWFVINRNRDMAGMLYFRGPNANIALVRHGINLSHPEKARIQLPFAAQPGTTYHVDNDYDMGAHRYTVTLTDKATGQVAVRLEGVPNVTSYTFAPSSKFLIDMGFREHFIPDEVPSYGWEHRDVHVEVYP